MRYRHRPFLAITERTPRPREGSDEWLLPEWIAWTLRHPPRCDYRMQVWDGCQWQNGPRYYYGDPWDEQMGTMIRSSHRGPVCTPGLIRGPGLIVFGPGLVVVEVTGNLGGTTVQAQGELALQARSASTCYVRYPALRSPLAVASEVGVGSEDEIEDEDTAPSCIFCLSSRATVSVPCPAEHLISCEACAGEIHF